MMEYDVINLIANFGFPIVAFLLIYLDMRKLVQTNTNAIQRLEKLMEKLIFYDIGRKIEGGQ